MGELRREERVQIERETEASLDSKDRSWEGRRRRSFWERKEWADEVAEAMSDSKLDSAFFLW